MASKFRRLLTGWLRRFGMPWMGAIEALSDLNGRRLEILIK
jgi:hypothetical protein